MGRPLLPLSIKAEDQVQLVAWSKRPKTAQALAMRSRVVLLAASGTSNTAIARQLGVTLQTVGKWRQRFLDQGVDGLLDEPRPGTSRKLRDRDVELVLALTLESAPVGATHWSTRSMAQRSGLSRASIHRIWQAFSLAPHRSETFKLSKDPLLIEKVRDIVGLYLAPPDRALVLCVDEKSQIQALDRTQPGLPIKKGRCGTMTHDYKRNGTATLFAALNALEGEVISMCDDRHRHQEWLKFLRAIDDVIPQDKQIHMIVDNYSTHKHEKVERWLSRHPRFHMHFTPTGCSWLNMVERFFRDLTENRLRRGVFRSVEELITAIFDYIDHHNENPKPFIWTAKAADILEKVKRARAALHNSQSA